MSYEPLIPYVTLPHLVLVPEHAFGNFPGRDIAVEPFGVLVALGVWVGAYLVVWQGKRRGLSERALTSFAVLVIAVGLVSAHVLDLLFYYPGELLKDPFALVRLWDGLSSFGGFIGAVGAGLYWRKTHRARLLPYADAASSTFPFAWIFGRLGCSVAHDHPGVPSELWLAVRYPGGARLDLGLLELAITIPIALSFACMWRRPRPFGTYTAILCLYYAPVRFVLDYFRAREPVFDELGPSGVDARYAALTPAQWACLALFVYGLGLAWYVRRHRHDASSCEAPEVPLAFRSPERVSAQP